MKKPFRLNSLDFGRASELQRAIEEGRYEDAKRIARQGLRAPNPSTGFLRLAAELLERTKPKAIYPKHWLEIGPDFDVLRTDGLTREAALEALSKKFGYGDTTIRNTVRFYHRALREVAEWHHEEGIERERDEARAEWQASGGEVADQDWKRE